MPHPVESSFPDITGRASFPAQNDLLAPTQYGLIFRHLPVAAFVISDEGSILDWNPAATRLFQWSREEAIDLQPALFGESPKFPRVEIARFVEGGGADSEKAYLRKDGSTGICRCWTVPMGNPADAAASTLEICQDITRERLAEKSTHKERLLQTLIDGLADTIFLKDSEGRFVFVNRAHEGLCHRRREEVIGKTVFELDGLRDHAPLYEADDIEVIQAGMPVINREEPFTRPDGSHGWLLTSKFPWHNPEGEIVGVFGVAHDITQRRTAELALADEKAKLKTILDAIADPVFVKDLSGRHVLFNEANLRLFGRTREEAMGTVFEMNIPLEVAESYAADDWIVMETGSPVINREEPYAIPSGGIGTLLTSKFPLHDSVGNTIGLVGISRDITELRKAQSERAKFDAALQETQRLESLGVLAGGIAHDFNNLLAVVLANASLARAEAECVSSGGFLLEIETAATRAADLCKQMLTYSGRASLELVTVDLNQLITETSDLLRVSVKKNVSLIMRLGQGPLSIRAEPTQIRQVIMNLITNASEAIGEGAGRVTICTKSTELDATNLSAMRVGAGLTPGSYASVEVTDTGPGMSSEVLQRIFEPFYTTKFTGRGLGLATVHGIVRRHDGALNVSSEAGAGTTFEVLFPCASPGCSAPTAVSSGNRDWRGSGRAFVIDDEEPLRLVAGRIMKALGFEPTMFAGGAEALAEFSRSSAEIAVVVLDLTMPGDNGLEVARKLLEIRKDVPILFMSGYTEAEIRRHFSEGAGPCFLQKPFSVDALREKVRFLIEGSRAK